MKRVARIGIVFGVAFGIFLIGNTQQASASTYHKGTPTAVRGYWRTKMKKLSDGGNSYFWSYSFAKIKKNYFSEVMMQAGGYSVGKLSYRYAGNHTYYVKGKAYMGTLNLGVFNWKIKKISSKKLRTKDLTQSNSKYRTWYKFSGKISKQKGYPYP